jgi:hypothetical protein
VLIWCEGKVLLAGCWWLVCSERKVLLAGKPNEQADGLEKEKKSKLMFGNKKNTKILTTPCSLKLLYLL